MLRIILTESDCDRDAKTFLKKMPKDLKSNEYDYLGEVVEKAPIFCDSRDTFIDNLENYLSTHTPLLSMGKFEYLELKEMKMIRRGGPHSLRGFFNKK